MPQPFENLSIVIERMARVPDRTATAGARRVFNIIGREVTAESPVDEGHFRSNWIGAAGQPVLTQIPPYHKLPKRTDPSKKFERANFNAARAQQRAASAVFDSRVHRSLFLTNTTRNLKTGEPYGPKLNDGRTPSQQTPPRFVDRAVAIGVLAAARILTTEARRLVHMAIR